MSTAILLLSLFLLVVRAPLVLWLEKTSTWVLSAGIWLVFFDLFLIVIVCVSLMMLINFFKTWLLSHYDVKRSDNLRQRKLVTQIKFVVKFAKFLVCLGGLIAFFFYFEDLRNLGKSLLASAGVAGVILGIAAQKTLGNLIAGFQISFTQPLRLDDAVVIEGEWGWIEEITLTYIVVRIWDQRRLVLPISYVLENPFQNWTRTSAEIVGSVVLYLDYRMPMEPIREELGKILEGSEQWDRRVNNVQVVESSETCQQVRILVSAENSPKAWDLRCLVREKMLAFLSKHYSEYLPCYRLKHEGFRDHKNP